MKLMEKYLSKMTQADFGIKARDYEPVATQDNELIDDFESIFTLLRMPLLQFKAGGYLVRVKSKVIGEDVFIASSEREAAIGKSEGLTVYHADELIQLVKGKPDSDELRIIHAAKKILQGTIIETKKREG